MVRDQRTASLLQRARKLGIQQRAQGLFYFDHVCEGDHPKDRDGYRANFIKKVFRAKKSEDAMYFAMNCDLIAGAA